MLPQGRNKMPEIVEPTVLYPIKEKFLCCHINKGSSESGNPVPQLGDLEEAVCHCIDDVVGTKAEAISDCTASQPSLSFPCLLQGLVLCPLPL